jgi:hypothetical protein
MKRNAKSIIVLLILAAAQLAVAQSVNVWRGDEARTDWNDKYKWKLKHVPNSSEAAHFREQNSVIEINSTVQLNNGMQLYGQELTLVGNGNLNLQNPVPHQRTVNIPASATGYANMTLNDNLSLNGRIALSAKSFGTSASKGSVTLNDRSTVSGTLSVGNQGSGTGQIFVRDNATYRITGLELDTRAQSGGSAEIHIIGGTVRIETKENPFDVFLADASRKLLIGEMGTLRIESDISAYQKKEQIKQMILQNRLVAAPGCRLTPPVINNKMLIIQAEDERNVSTVQTREDLLAAIDKLQIARPASVAAKPRLESLLKSIKSQPAAPSASVAANAPAEKEDSSAKEGVGLAGYIVFCGTCLLVLRRSDEDEEPAETEQN